MQNDTPQHPLTHARLMEIVEVAASSAARNIGVSADQVLPHLYLPLKRALLPDDAPACAQEAASASSALRAAEVAMQGAVSVMENELAGLQVIQPELAGLREALQCVRAELAGG